MKIITFNSSEELIAHLGGMRERFKEAHEKADIWQKALGPGRYFLRFVDDMVIFCHVLPMSELCADDQESVQESLTRGFLFCNCYSPICPTGEMGDVHCSCADFPLTVDQFNQAQSLGWPQDSMQIKAILNVSDMVGDA